MSRRRLLLAAAALALLGLAAGLVVWVTYPREHCNCTVTSENFHRLKYGLTVRQVEGVFGGPGEEQWSYSFGFDMAWEGPTVHVILSFCNGGLVTGTLFNRDSGQQERATFMPAGRKNIVQKSEPAAK
jgi:hypothetical protein